MDKQEDVAGCWSAANSGTNARLRPLNIMAGSGESKRVRERVIIVIFPLNLFLCYP